MFLSSVAGKINFLFDFTSGVDNNLMWWWRIYRGILISYHPVKSTLLAKVKLDKSDEFYTLEILLHINIYSGLNSTSAVKETENAHMVQLFIYTNSLHANF